MSRQFLMLGWTVVFLATVLVAILGRYTVIGAPEAYAFAYRLDRWTGEIIPIRQDEVMPMHFTK